VDREPARAAIDHRAGAEECAAAAAGGGEAALEDDMTRRIGSLLSTIVAAIILCPETARAQTDPAVTVQQSPADQPGDEPTRPATTTFYGDTGIWFVPTAEILPPGKISISGYRRGTNYVQGYTNVADFAGTVAVGVASRLEVFASFLFDTRIDRDVRPLFVADPTFGGPVDRYPYVNTGWTGDNVGDLYVGAKVNLFSESRNNTLALAVRGMGKFPTGDRDRGVGTGETDFLADLIISKESKAEFAGYVGYAYLSEPEGLDTPTGAFRWGVGTSMPSRSVFRFFAELNGYVPSTDTTTITTASLVGVDGSLPPAVFDVDTSTRATLGTTLQVSGGFFLGAGLSWNTPAEKRATGDSTGDYWDWQVRIGYHPGTRRAPIPLPPSPPAAPETPAGPDNRPPTVEARCDPCTVTVGASSKVDAFGVDPDGDTLAYHWTAPTGTFADPSAQGTTWTAPQQIGSVPLTVSVDDGHGGKASANLTLQVVSPPLKSFTFEDVHFDFDRYTLRPEATRILDEAVAAFRENPTLRLTIEGHTCNIGTAEYNLALGERRAAAVREYLTSRGVPVDRLQTISYGEERPKYDNVREETRRMNRRAALVVRLEK
jgi:outer membrane protein OmpA-like peptidoglycan-associated protein